VGIPKEGIRLQSAEGDGGSSMQGGVGSQPATEKGMCGTGDEGSSVWQVLSR
jgi:hypothetical protein